MGLGHEKFSTTILLIPLHQEEQLPVTGKRMCTQYQEQYDKVKDWLQMSRIMRKPVFGVSDQVQHKQGCTAKDNGSRLEMLDLGSFCLIYLI